MPGVQGCTCASRRCPLKRAFRCLRRQILTDPWRKWKPYCSAPNLICFFRLKPSPDRMEELLLNSLSIPQGMLLSSEVLIWLRHRPAKSVFQSFKGFAVWLWMKGKYSVVDHLNPCSDTPAVLLYQGPDMNNMRQGAMCDRLEGLLHIRFRILDASKPWISPKLGDHVPILWFHDYRSSSRYSCRYMSFGGRFANSNQFPPMRGESANILQNAYANAGPCPSGLPKIRRLSCRGVSRTGV